jgi:dihydroneopterin aldolase
MEGIIRLEEYKIHCILGAHAYEREEEQEILLDVEMRTNFFECAQTDSISDTIDYTRVGQLCRDLARSRRYHLLETFAFEAVHALMEAFSPQSVKVRLQKKNALPLAKSAVVELELLK